MKYLIAFLVVVTTSMLGCTKELTKTAYLPGDTVIVKVHDTLNKIKMDTFRIIVVRTDTIIKYNHDTIDKNHTDTIYRDHYRTDTIIIRTVRTDTLFQIKYDTFYIRKTDTIVKNTTTTIYKYDTITNTLIKYDTITKLKTVLDTLTRTVYLHDTITNTKTKVDTFVVVKNNYIIQIDTIKIIDTIYGPAPYTGPPTVFNIQVFDYPDTTMGNFEILWIDIQGVRFIPDATGFIHVHEPQLGPDSTVITTTGLIIDVKMRNDSGIQKGAYCVAWTRDYFDPFTEIQYFREGYGDEQFLIFPYFNPYMVNAISVSDFGFQKTSKTSSVPGPKLTPVVYKDKKVTAHHSTTTFGTKYKRAMFPFHNHLN